MSGGGGDVDPKISAQEVELSRIAKEQADLWWEKGAPAQLEWIKGGLVTKEDRDLMAGEISSQYSSQMAGAQEQMQNQLAQRGVDPSSGNYAAAMTDFTTTGGKGLSGSQSAGEIAMGNKQLGHLQNAAGVLRGEAGQAQDSMSTLARAATQESISDAWGDQASRNQTQDMWGGIAGGLIGLGKNTVQDLKKKDPGD